MSTMKGSTIRRAAEAERDQRRIDTLADVLDVAEDGGATVVPIARVREIIGRAHLCRLEHRR